MRLEKLGPNFHAVSQSGYTVWFSYETPIAFQEGFKPPVLRQNEWRATTGKHLNSISEDKASRLSGKEFIERLPQFVKADAPTT